MSNELVAAPKKDRDTFKEPGTLDDALNAKLSPVIDEINNHVKAIYKDFNMALFKQMQGMDKMEKDLSQMVQTLWGIINESNARTAALETVLIKNGMNPTELQDELENIKEQLKATGQWVEVPLMPDAPDAMGPGGLISDPIAGL